jgi:hypothetical protein
MFTGTLERFGGREPRQIRVFIEGIARQAICADLSLFSAVCVVRGLFVMTSPINWKLKISDFKGRRAGTLPIQMRIAECRMRRAARTEWTVQFCS